MMYGPPEPTEVLHFHTHQLLIVVLVRNFTRSECANAIRSSEAFKGRMNYDHLFRLCIQHGEKENE